MKYVTYYRVSTKKQGLGLEAQQTTVAHYLHDGDEVISSYQEKESGRHNDRPELMKAMQDCKNTGATLLIAKLDRLSRDVEFLFSVKNSGVNICAVDCPLLNTMTLAVMAGLAQQEAELISSRTKAALAELKRQGKKLGRPGACFTDEQRATAVAVRQDAARRNEANVRAWAIVSRNGGLTLTALAAMLNDYHQPTPKGGLWRGNQVKRLIELYS